MLVIVVGIGGVLLWQLILNLPIIAPRFASRLGLRSRRSDFRQEFFARCMLLLSKLALNESTRRLRKNSPWRLRLISNAKVLRPISSEWLSRLTQAYYRLRFGNTAQLSDQEQLEVQRALRNLEKSANSLPSAKE